MRLLHILLLGGVVLIRCAESPEQNDSICSQQGLFEESTRIDVNSLKLDSAQFAIGSFLFVLNGKCLINGDTSLFNLTTRSNPLIDDECHVLSHSCLVLGRKSQEFTCSVATIGNDLVLRWDKDSCYLNLRVDKRLIAGH